VASSAGEKQAGNIAAFDRETVVEEFSHSKLNVAEEDLFQRYYQRGESVLDLACGAGRTTVRLNEIGLTAKGTDTSKTLIAAAQKQYPALDFALGSYFETGLPSASYDHVLIAFNGLDYAYPEHCRLTAIRECHRVLKPGGTFIFSSHNIQWRRGTPWRLRQGSIGIKLWQMVRAFKARDYMYEAAVGTYTFFGSPRYIARQVEEQGFAVEEMVGLPRFWGTECYSTRRLESGSHVELEPTRGLTLPNSNRYGHVYYVFRKL
jgi:ubiquinone/menaquinone biosynthesis C-methylase UbiE